MCTAWTGFRNSWLGAISGSVWNEVGVARRISVGAPHALEYSCFRVEYDDAPVQVTIGEINLVSFFVQIDSGRAAEDADVHIIHGRRGRMADLQNKFPFVRELDCLPVFGAIAGNPDVSGMVDEDAVLRIRPVIALARAAPGFEKIALGIKHKNRRRGNAAFRSRRSLRRAEIILRVRARTLQHPDVVLPIDGHSADLPHDPIVGQLFWPGGVDLIRRRRLSHRDRANTKRQQKKAHRNKHCFRPTTKAGHDNPPNREPRVRIQIPSRTGIYTRRPGRRMFP